MKKSESNISDELPHILVVDDDRRLRILLARFLSENGYRVTVAKEAAEARDRFNFFVFDGIILDIMMPGENGFDFARAIRLTSSIPILLLTARTASDDRIAGLEIGADDYLAKPFVPRELLLRLNNILRRTAVSVISENKNILYDKVHFGDFVFRLDRSELKKGDEPIRLTDRERELLRILSSKAGNTVLRGEIADGDVYNERTVDVQINRLRRKIEVDPSNPMHLQTVRGLGYRLLVD